MAVAMSRVEPVRQLRQSKSGRAWGIYSPPSGASPSSTAWALVAWQARLLVE